MSVPTARYSPPVSQLLALGERRLADPWADPSELGIGREDIPALMAMMTDPALNRSPDELEHWAPLHAWRALARLRAGEAIEPMIRLRIELPDDDWLASDFPRAMGMIGRPAIPALVEALDRPGDPVVRGSMAEAIARIGQTDREARDRCASILAERLEHFERQEPELNGFIVSSLLDLEAVEYAAVIERAMTSGKVDESIVGDWEDVQVELGLLDARKTPARSPLERLTGKSFHDELLDIVARHRARSEVEDESLLAAPATSGPPPSQRERAKRKKKRKAARAARRRNRR